MQPSSTIILITRLAFVRLLKGCRLPTTLNSKCPFSCPNNLSPPVHCRSDFVMRVEAAVLKPLNAWYTQVGHPQLVSLGAKPPRHTAMGQSAAARLSPSGHGGSPGRGRSGLDGPSLAWSSGRSVWPEPVPAGERFGALWLWPPAMWAMQSKARSINASLMLPGTNTAHRSLFQAASIPFVP